MVNIAEIHASLVNGQRKQMAKQIQEYGVYDFVTDYKAYINEQYETELERVTWIADAALSYLRITCR